MKEIRYQVANPLGIHARCAGLFAQKAVEWKSAVTMSAKGKSGNAKQVLDILNLGVQGGEEVCITVEGADENEAYAALSELLPKLFG
jgi:phosphotransferase system HPr (HPr) family protein